MLASVSFNDHIAGLLSEHQMLQRCLGEVRQENARLHERLKQAGLAQEPEFPLPQQPERVGGPGAQKLALADGAELVPVADVGDGAGGTGCPGNFGGQGTWSPKMESSTDFGHSVSLEKSDAKESFLLVPPELWPEFENQCETPHTDPVSGIVSRRNSNSSIVCGEAVLDHKSQWQRLVLRPNSHGRTLWDCICFAMLGYDILYLPLEAFTLSPLLIQLASTMDTVSTCFWTVDILMTFITGYHTEGIVEMRPKKIAARHFGGLFWLDFPVVCVDWALLVWQQRLGVVHVGKTPRAVRLLRIMRTTRLLRSLNMAKRMMAMYSSIKSDLLRTVCSLSSIIVVLFVFNHYIAAGWFAIGMSSGGGWPHAAGIEACEPLYCYMTSLHWSLTQHAPASMEVHAVNLQERAYSVFVLLFGMVCFSSFVSSITSAIMHLKRLRAERTQQEATLRQYFQESKISAELGQRIWLFLQNSHFQNKKQLHRNDLDILKLVPECMKKDLNEELYLPVLDWNPFFKRYGQAHLPVVRKVCHRCMTEKFLHRGEELFTENMAAESMSFVTTGSMDYYHRHADLCTSVGCRGWACEAVLWTAWKHCGCFAARTSCEIVQLHAGRFRSVSCEDSLSRNYVSGVARRFRNSLLSNEMWYTDVRLYGWRGHDRSSIISVMSSVTGSFHD